MTWKALTGAMCVCLALELSVPVALAATSPLSYQTLLAVDDPGKPAASTTAESPSATLDDETPAALKGGPTPPEPTAEELEAEAKLAAAAKAEDEESVFKKWWFWTLTAAIVGSTVALGVWAAQPTDAVARSCLPKEGFIACFGDGRQ